MTDDGTPISDILAENRELKAEVLRLKRLCRSIAHACGASGPFTAARRREVRDLADTAQKAETPETQYARLRREDPQATIAVSDVRWPTE